jgi:hypothetical protein
MSIFCQECGKKLEENDKFCQFCGANIKTENISSSKSVNKSFKREALENKAWFRGIKVFYFLFIAFFIIAICAISLDSKPTKRIDGEKSLIVCNSGKSYAPEKNSIYLYGYQEDLTSSNDSDARILCKYDTLAFSLHSSESIEKNYIFRPVYDDSEISSWAWYSLLSFFILFVIAYLLKIIFFYIALGEKPRPFKRIIK